MPHRHPALARPPRYRVQAAIAAAALVGLGSFGCGHPVSAPTTSEARAAHEAPAPSRFAGGVAGSQAPFQAWHQGFNHETDGWYGAETADALGWCGSIVHQDRRTGDVRPSAGRGHAVVQAGPCNEFWTELGVPAGAPYGPGPNRSLYSDVWPRSGFVTELDIYLDPSWSGAFSGTFSPGTLVEYGATIFPLEGESEVFHTRPHYFVQVEAVDGEEALSIFGQRVDEAGWYTFRFVFQDEGGQVRVDFELEERRGGTLLTERDLPAFELFGPVKAPYLETLRTSEYGSGHVWFFDIAAGLELPIDEHRVRPGR